uniref:Uncharacterized protein n=1 Tax=Arundo donax TaxID=35708 RepID=A0A0A9AVI3_ARUDO
MGLWVYHTYFSSRFHTLTTTTRVIGLGIGYSCPITVGIPLRRGLD